MAVVGDVQPDAVRDAVAELLVGLKEVNASSYALQQPVPPTAKIVQVQTAKPITAAQIGFGPGITRDDPDYATLQVLGRMMSDFPSGWLEQELRGKGPGLVYAV